MRHHAVYLNAAMLTVILAFALACASPNTRGTVEAHYDEFRQSTDLVASFDQPPFNVRMLALPDRRGGSSMGTLTIGAVSSEWRYLRCHTVDMLADGRPVPLPDFEHEGDVGRLIRSPVMHERVTATLPKETFDAMASASSIRVRLCNDVIEFSAEQVATVHDFVRRWNAISSSSVAVRPSTTDAGPAPVAMLPCGIPAGYIRICQSSRGYRFAIPYPEPCAGGSQAAGAVQLTCEATSHPAYHACLNESGAWTPVHSWVSCDSRGLMNAAGDFVPPGRQPEQGVAPDAADPALAR